MKSPLITKYGAEPRFVTWKLETVNEKPTKVPYIAGTNKKASSTDPKTWVNANKVKGNTGIVLHDKLLLCIDIDHVLEGKKIVSSEAKNIASLIRDADTYTEISQSGTGLHLFLALTEPLDLSNNKKAPYEVYTNGRYICTTGISYRKEKEVRTITPAEAFCLIEKIVPQKKEEITINKISTEENLTDEEVLSIMFHEKNGDKIKRIYEGDNSDYKNDASSADLALFNKLAFYTGRNANQMERIFKDSPRGKREKVKERGDYYLPRTAEKAISKCTEVYKPPATKSLDLLFTIKKIKDEEIKVFTLNTENIARVISRHKDFVDSIRYDKFSNQIEVKENNTWREFGVGDEIVIQTKISILFPCFGTVNKQMVFDAIVKVARDNSIDSAIDYLKSITWDEAPRLDHWLAHTYGVPEDEYHQKVASNWLKGLVKRLVVPGSKFDYVLVLEGEQGAKKSSSLEALGGNWHVETAMSTDNKDFFMQFPGKAIIEFSEGETLSRTEVKRMKAIITMQKDRYRLPYARTTQDFPRRCVFAMTTNDTEYLKDETGNRRWLPVATIFPEANIEWLTQNRDQLFAEAYHRVITLKETTYEFPKEATKEAQDSRMVSDPNSEIISDWYHNILNDTDRANGITAQQVFTQCLHKNFSTTMMKKYEEMMIINILKKDLKLNKERMMVNKVQANRWFGEKAEIPTGEKIELTELVF